MGFTNTFYDPFNPIGAKVFVGFAPRTQEMEIIAFDRYSGRFEFFQGARNGKKFDLRKSDRGVCISCHQGGGPIFSAPRWLESAAHAEVRMKLETRKFEPFVRWALEESDAKNFDFMLRDANKMLQSTRICRTACKDDLNCRRFMLTKALLPLTAPSPAQDRSYMQSTGARDAVSFLQSHWPREKFAYPDDALPDRDPEKELE